MKLRTEIKKSIEEKYKNIIESLTTGMRKKNEQRKTSCGKIALSGFKLDSNYLSSNSGIQ